MNGKTLSTWQRGAPPAAPVPSDAETAKPSPNVPASRPTFAWAVAVLAALIVLAVNWPVLGFDWLIFDDDINILVNPHLGAGAGESVRWAFENVDYMRRYLPLGWLAFGGLLAVDGYNPAVFHAANWLLTGLNTLLIFFVFEHLAGNAGRSRSGGPVAGHVRSRIAAAAFAALLWSLHPLRVENAAWISGFLYVGSTTLALAAVLLHLRGTERKSPVALCAGAVAYLGSLLIYPVYLSLPAILVWRALVMGSERWAAVRQELRRTAGWWIAALGCGGMTLFARAVGSEIFTPATGAYALTWLESLDVAVRATLHYAGRTLWPGDVGVYYGGRDLWLAHWSQQLAASVAVIFAVVLLVRRSTRRSVVGWSVAAVLSLAPFLAQMDSTFHPSDRYAVLWLAVWGAAIAIWLARVHGGRVLQSCHAVGAVGLVALIAVYRTVLPNWKDTAALQASIDRHATSSVSHGFARPAIAAWWLGDHTTATRRLAEGAARFPGHPEIIQAQATLEDLERLWRARVGTRQDIAPFAVFHVDLGRHWLARGESQAAAAHFARALHLAPGYPEAARGWLRTQPRQ